jgi:hypothetical protein
MLRRTRRELFCLSYYKVGQLPRFARPLRKIRSLALPMIPDTPLLLPHDSFRQICFRRGQLLEQLFAVAGRAEEREPVPGDIA